MKQKKKSIPFLGLLNLVFSVLKVHYATFHVENSRFSKPY